MVDTLGFRKLIGLVVPSTNTVVQPESEALRPNGVTNHVGRISFAERPLTSDEAVIAHMEAMRGGLAAAIDQVMTCRPDHLIMGIALEAFWGGVEASRQLAAQLEAQAGVGVSMGAPAIDAALKAFGVRRIAVMTPHQPRGDAMVRQYLEEAGYDIVKLIGLKCTGARDIAQVSVERMRQTLGELDSPDVEALVQVGTNLPGSRLAAAAEHFLGKPVLAINTVTYWDALRRNGITDKIVGHGSVLERF